MQTLDEEFEQIVHVVYSTNISVGAEDASADLVLFAPSDERVLIVLLVHGR